MTLHQTHRLMLALEQWQPPPGVTHEVYRDTLNGAVIVTLQVEGRECSYVFEAPSATEAIVVLDRIAADLLAVHGNTSLPKAPWLVEALADLRRLRVNAQACKRPVPDRLMTAVLWTLHAIESDRLTAPMVELSGGLLRVTWEAHDQLVTLAFARTSWTKVQRSYEGRHEAAWHRWRELQPAVIEALEWMEPGLFQRGGIVLHGEATA